MRRGPKQRFEQQRARWMAEVERLVCEQDARFQGRMPWPDATYLFNTGKTPDQAAASIVLTGNIYSKESE
jgi:hypothetical protein